MELQKLNKHFYLIVIPTVQTRRKEIKYLPTGMLLREVKDLMKNPTHLNALKLLLHFKELITLQTLAANNPSYKWNNKIIDSEAVKALNAQVKWEFGDEFTAETHLLYSRDPWNLPQI